MKFIPILRKATPSDLGATQETLTPTCSNRSVIIPGFHLSHRRLKETLMAQQGIRCVGSIDRSRPTWLRNQERGSSIPSMLSSRWNTSLSIRQGSSVGGRWFEVSN